MNYAKKHGLAWIGLALASLLLFGCSNGSTHSASSASTGSFVDSAVEGLGYRAGDLSGVTNAAGEFEYFPGDTVTFSIGELVLGSCTAKELVTPADLLTGASDPAAATLNMARLLLSLDADGDPDNGITLDADTVAAISDAVASGATVEFDVPTVSFDAADLLAAAAPGTSLLSAADAAAHLQASLGLDLSAAVTYAFDATGGDGYIGGPGGYVEIYKTFGAGTIEILESGSADASFTPTLEPAVELGAAPLTVTADTTIVAISAEGAEPAAGTPYLVELGDTLYVSDGNGTLGDEEPVTGLSVAAGATLTLEPNWFGSEASFALENDLVNRGTITTADESETARGSLTIDLDNFVNLGTVATYGVLPGQDGGALDIFAWGDIYNHGPVLTYGADNAGKDGGSGGNVDFYTDSDVEPYGGLMENTALIDAHGGNGTTGVGGDAGDVYLQPYRSVYNSGDIDARGGDGTAGGWGGTIDVWGWYVGDCLNSGDLDVSGGDATAGPGGARGLIEIGAYGGATISSGDLIARGGDTADAESDAGGAAEDPGGIVIQVYEADEFPVTRNAGDVQISGNIDLSGGDATAPEANGSGGEAGYFVIELDNGYDEGEQKISLLGYPRIDAAGGTGYAGGAGDTIDIYQDSTSGPVAIEADLDVSGGNGVIEGAGGGMIYLWGDVVTTSGALDASGGDADPTEAGSIGGDGGVVEAQSTSLPSSIGVEPDVNGGTGETPGSDGDVFIDTPT